MKNVTYFALWDCYSQGRNPTETPLRKLTYVNPDGVKRGEAHLILLITHDKWTVLYVDRNLSTNLDVIGRFSLRPKHIL